MAVSWTQWSPRSAPLQMRMTSPRDPPWRRTAAHRRRTAAQRTPRSAARPRRSPRRRSLATTRPRPWWRRRTLVCPRSPGAAAGQRRLWSAFWGSCCRRAQGASVPQDVGTWSARRATRLLSLTRPSRKPPIPRPPQPPSRRSSCRSWGPGASSCTPTVRRSSSWLAWQWTATTPTSRRSSSRWRSRAAIGPRQASVGEALALVTLSAPAAVRGSRHAAATTTCGA
mmetsp:Transcript_58672/g.164627  ORF Transcript_58672/g.164627 Transcript_58672/m.164627 type:complete len:226 (+) Transcript_58672:474-1151(+)